MSRHYSQAAAIAAEVTGVDLRAVLSTRRRAEVADARALTAYLTVMCFGHSRRQVARLAGVNAMVVVRACSEIEALRDLATVDQAITATETWLSGPTGGVCMLDPFARQSLCEALKTARPAIAGNRGRVSIAVREAR